MRGGRAVPEMDRDAMQTRWRESWRAGASHGRGAGEARSWACEQWSVRVSSGSVRAFAARAL